MIYIAYILVSCFFSLPVAPFTHTEVHVFAESISQNWGPSYVNKCLLIVSKLHSQALAFVLIYSIVMGNVLQCSVSTPLANSAAGLIGRKNPV